MEIKKVEQNGKIAVLVSHGYGAGWSTWNDHEYEMCVDADLVNAVLDDNREECARIAKEKYGAYTGGAEDLVVEWVSRGYQFEISEYDGNESLIIIGKINAHVA